MISERDLALVIAGAVPKHVIMLPEETRAIAKRVLEVLAEGAAADSVSVTKHGDPIPTGEDGACAAYFATAPKGSVHRDAAGRPTSCESAERHIARLGEYLGEANDKLAQRTETAEASVRRALTKLIELYDEFDSDFVACVSEHIEHWRKLVTTPTGSVAK